MPVTANKTSEDVLEMLLKQNGKWTPESAERSRLRRERLASAEWAHPETLSISQKAKGLLYLGNADADTHRCLGLCNEYHVLVNGGTRSGKGVAFITSNLLLWHGSAIVNDPKGENATVTARRRATGSAFAQGMGQKVFILDPFGVAGRPDDPLTDLQAQFNPLKGLNPKDPHVIDLVNEIASSMVVVPKDTDNRMWTQAARGLLKATILHVISSPDFDEGDRNLVTVYELLCHGDREKKAFLDQIGADSVPPAHLLLYAAMEQNSAFGGIVASAGETYRHLLTQAPKQYLGVIENLKSELEFMDSPGVQECLLDSSFSLDDLKNDPNGVTVYLCLPLRLLETHFRWLRIIISQAMNTMERQKYRPRSGWPVLFMLDEFAALHKMPSLQNGIAQMAGHGMKIVLIVQDYNQLRGVYGSDAWETFVANCGVKVFLSTEDHFTRDYASKLVGEAEIAVANRNASLARNTSATFASNWSEATGLTIGETITTGTSDGGSSSSGPGLMAFSSSRNWSSTSSHASTLSESVTRTHGGSASHTDGKSETVGVQINWQTRPLVRPDEVGRIFAYREEPNGVPFAGNILVLVAGEHAIALRRTLYYRHACFEGLFDPHPEFPVEAAYRAPVTVDALPLPQDPPKPTIRKRKATRWQRFIANMQDVVTELRRVFLNKWAALLFWLPLGLVSPIIVLFSALGMAGDLVVVLLATAINFFPFLLGA